MLRHPAVSGQFYPGTKAKLLSNIESLLDKNAKKRDAIACILPHAGYMYSGPVAGATVSALDLNKSTFIIIGPNHTGYGEPFSVFAEGDFRTPLGDVPVDAELAGGLLNNSKYLKADTAAHRYEHSIEVELPFLQYFNPDFKIVPIVASTGNKEIYKEVGLEISSIVKAKGLKEKIMLIASSDMTHYESDKSARSKDQQAISAILELDEDKLLERVERLDISMCGYVPVTIALVAAKELGAKEARLIKYQTSGDVTGDNSAVVGYAGMIIY